MELGLLHWQQGGHLENVRAHRVWILKVASEQRYTQAQARNLIMGVVLSPGGRRGQLGQALGAMSACSSEDTGELLSREFHDTLSLSVSPCAELVGGQQRERERSGSQEARK